LSACQYANPAAFFKSGVRLAEPFAADTMPAVVGAHMKVRRLVIFIVLAIAVAAMVGAFVTAHWERKQPVFTEAPKLLGAMRAFSDDLKRKGRPLPSTVSLSDLVSGGYLATNDVRAFEGMDVAISLAASEDYPSSILMSARLPDGSVTALLADGSVAQMSRTGFENYLKNSGQTNGEWSSPPPLRRETNRPPPAGGSPR
jgi:hypothetical protein